MGLYMPNKDTITASIERSFENIPLDVNLPHTELVERLIQSISTPLGVTSPQEAEMQSWSAQQLETQDNLVKTAYDRFGFFLGRDSIDDNVFRDDVDSINTAKELQYQSPLARFLARLQIEKRKLELTRYKREMEEGFNELTKQPRIDEGTRIKTRIENNTTRLDEKISRRGGKYSQVSKKPEPIVFPSRIKTQGKENTNDKISKGLNVLGNKSFSPSTMPSGVSRKTEPGNIKMLVPVIAILGMLFLIK